MLDMSWGEVMVIGAVALIVIGPKDLPRALRTVGNFTGKIRRMAAEFQGQFNEAMREAELDDVKKQLQGVNESVSSLNSTSFNPIQTIRDELKGAVEGQVTDAGKVAPPEADVAAGQGAGEAGSSVLTDSALDLPAPPPVPDLPDPAHEIAESLRKEAEAAREAASAEAAQVKPDAKA